MAWQTPKTDWTSEDGVRDSDLNRIEGNLAHLYNDKVRADTTLYVDATNGSDTTGTGEAHAPFKSINKALSSISRDTNGKNVLISITGGYYPEDVVIKGFNAPIVLTNGGETINVRSLRVEGCHCSLSGNIEILTNSAVYVVDGGMLTGAGSLYVNGASVNLNYGATVSLILITCDNSPDFAINLKGSSRLYTTELYGRANASGLRVAEGSILAYGSNTMGVNGLASITTFGGRILTGSGTTGGLPGI